MSAVNKKKKANKKNKAANAEGTQTEIKATPQPTQAAKPEAGEPKVTTQQLTETKAETKADTKPAVPVPNVTSKASEQEQARLQAQLGNMQKVAATLFVIGAQNETKKWDLEAKETDLKKVPTAYFKNCSKGTYTLGKNHRTTKLLIEGCKDSTFTIDGDVLTRTVEVWRCENCVFHFNTQVKTVQLDLSTKVSLHYRSKDDFGSIVWASVEQADITFADAKEHNLQTGFKEMLKEHPDSKLDIDQFIVRFLQDKLTPERCIRLKNGYLSTEREAVDWEKRNEIKKNQYVEDFLKNAGVHLKKAKDAKPKVSPNEPCPCGSGKKHKKCCMNKTVLSGVEGDDKKAVV